MLNIWRRSLEAMSAFLPAYDETSPAGYLPAFSQLVLSFDGRLHIARLFAHAWYLLFP